MGEQYKFVGVIRFSYFDNNIDDKLNHCIEADIAFELSRSAFDLVPISVVAYYVRCASLARTKNSHLATK